MRRYWVAGAGAAAALFVAVAAWFSLSDAAAPATPKKAVATVASADSVAPAPIPLKRPTAETPPKAAEPPPDGMTRLVVTTRQQEEAARVQASRAIHWAQVGKSAAIDPATSRQLTGRLSMPLEEREWVEAFHQAGVAAPDRIVSRVAGKIMSPISREGLPNLRVVLLSFLPSGDELYPVVTELVTDGRGEFAGEVPLPKKAPADHPALGLLCYQPSPGGDHLIIQGAAIRNLSFGPAPQQLGIFWAPQNPFEVSCDARAVSGPDLSVACTGALNPARWTSTVRGDLMTLFAPRSVDATTGKCLLGATWEGKECPWVTLLKVGSTNQTRRCVVKANPPPTQCFEEIIFTFDPLAGLAGHVEDAAGIPVAGASVTTVGNATPVTAVTGADGNFTIPDPGPDVKSLRITHEDFITVEQPVGGGRIVLPQRKPVFRFTLRDGMSNAALDGVRVRILQGGFVPQRIIDVDLVPLDGLFSTKVDFLFTSLTLTKVGYFPRTVARSPADAVLELKLTPGRRLAIRPRDFSAVSRTDRYFVDPEGGEGVTTNWANEWIEWRIDFGAPPEDGLEGGGFELALGCTNNHGLIDNGYRFNIQVDVDGVKLGALDIAADNVNVQIGRVGLGRLAGVHLIRLSWLNDKWIPDQLDANIRYATLQFVEQP